jgi:hypothetical protein
VTLRTCHTAVCMIAAVTVFAACSSDDSGSGGSTAPTPSASASTETPTVLTFEVGDAMCTADSGAVKVTWTTENATGVEFAVDGETTPLMKGFSQEGDTTLDIPCSGGASTISITPLNDEVAGETVDEKVGG